MIRLLIGGLLLSGIISSAHADAYRCERHDGKVSFAETPCGPDEGTVSTQMPTERTILTSVSAQDADPMHINKRAADILSSGYNHHYTYKEIIVNAPVKPVPKPRPASVAVNVNCDSVKGLMCDSTGRGKLVPARGTPMSSALVDGR